MEAPITETRKPGQAGARLAITTSFVICALMCAVPLFAPAGSICNSCTIETPKLLIIAAATSWAIASWFAWTVPFVGVVIGIALTVAHATFAISNWNAACTGCIILLATELGSMAICLWKSASWTSERILARSKWYLPISGTLGAAVGLFMLPAIVFPDCPRSLREVAAPSLEAGSSTTIIFVDPHCHFCAEMKETVLPEFRSHLSWFELSRCSSQGSKLMREFDVSSFPTLVVTNGRLPTKRVSGIEDIRTALVELRSKKTPSAQ